MDTLNENLMKIFRMIDSLLGEMTLLCGENSLIIRVGFAYLQENML